MHLTPQADSASTLDRVAELEEQLRTTQQEKDLLNEMLQQSEVCCVQLMCVCICVLQRHVVTKECALSPNVTKICVF